MKKFIAELIGTCTLVVLGCGTAMLVGCDAAAGGGYVLTALAFGLAIVASAYCIGNISGCHVNPAVSLGVLLSGGMKGKEFGSYLVAQCLGALIGSGLLALIFKLGGVTDMTLAGGGFGTNGLGGVNGSAVAGLLVHVFLSSHKREELIRYYESQKNERFEQELQEAKDKWEQDNLRMKEEFNQIIEKQLEPFKNLKDKLDR